jgi:hypothetical protein
MNLFGFLRYLAPTVALLAIAGCAQDGPELAEVTGTVRLDGQPVPGANVVFRPQEGQSGSPAYGITDAEGNYVLRFTRDKEGVIPGKYDVEITTEKLSAEDAEALKAEGQDVYEFVRVPAKYGRPGELKREVPPEGGTVDFDLQGASEAGA